MSNNNIISTHPTSIGNLAHGLKIQSNANNNIPNGLVFNGIDFQMYAIIKPTEDTRFDDIKNDINSNKLIEVDSSKNAINEFYSTNREKIFPISNVEQLSISSHGDIASFFLTGRFTPIFSMESLTYAGTITLALTPYGFIDKLLQVYYAFIKSIDKLYKKVNYKSGVIKSVINNFHHSNYRDLGMYIGEYTIPFDIVMIGNSEYLDPYTKKPHRMLSIISGVQFIEGGLNFSTDDVFTEVMIQYSADAFMYPIDLDEYLTNSGDSIKNNIINGTSLDTIANLDDYFKKIYNLKKDGNK